MAVGRPPEGTRHVDRLEGPEETKRRLRVILETLREECTVEEACERLGVSEARFHALRHQALRGALAGLAPAAPGRPRKVEEEESSRVRQLERQVEELKFDLQAERVRTEIALTMPHLLRERTFKKKSRRGSSRTKGTRRRADERGGATSNGCDK
jgi:transposase